MLTTVAAECGVMAGGGCDGEQQSMLVLSRRLDLSDKLWRVSSGSGHSRGFAGRCTW